jgi:hypothetical protein
MGEQIFLLGRHRALLDNNYGKLSSFIAAWNTNWSDMQICHELPMALRPCGGKSRKSHGAIGAQKNADSS